MRTLALGLLLAVLSVEMGVATAQGPAVAPTGAVSEQQAGADAKANAEVAPAVKNAEQRATARLVEPQREFKMGDTVQVKVAGNHRLAVTNSKATGVLLVLDDVVMKSIGEPLATQNGAGDLILSFRLSRDPESNDSRGEWKKLLAKQHDGYLMTFPITLAIGSSAALPVATDELKFSVTTKGKMNGTLVAGLVIFGVLYWWLIRDRSALRDFRDGTYSLGKSQMAFWGLLVVLTFVGVWLNTGLIEHIPDQVLILLGISGATGLGALVIGDGTKAAEIAKLEDQLKALPEDDRVGRQPIEVRLAALLAGCRT